ncbi:MAG: hypothetical protein JOS17DRAFT_515566 [Linnemannia elongata]|nr:MAG: hypothetical protein JOS17DRAFT_515566 [Linnemannia elongata]
MRPYDPNHPLHLPIYPEGYVQSPTLAGTRSPSHGIESFVYSTFKRNPSLPYSSSSEEDEDEELLAPPRPVRIPGCLIGSFASMSTTRSPSQGIQPVGDTLSDRKFDFSFKEDNRGNEDEKEDNELEPIQGLRTPSVFPDANATTSTTTSPSQNIQPVVADIPSARQSIIIIEDDEDDEDEVWLVPMPKKVLSAEEITSTMRSSAQDIRPKVFDTPSTHQPSIVIGDDEDEGDKVVLVPMPRRFLDAEPTTTSKQSPSQHFRPITDIPLKCALTPLERNPNLPVECESSWRESSLPVVPDFKCLRSPTSLINTSSTRPTKRETTPLVAVKSEKSLESNPSTSPSISAQRRSATTPVGVSPTVLLTEKAKEAKRKVKEEA